MGSTAWLRLWAAPASRTGPPSAPTRRTRSASSPRRRQPRPCGGRVPARRPVRGLPNADAAVGRLPRRDRLRRHPGAGTGQDAEFTNEAAPRGWKDLAPCRRRAAPGGFTRTPDRSHCPSTRRRRRGCRLSPHPPPAVVARSPPSRVPCFHCATPPPRTYDPTALTRGSLVGQPGPQVNRECRF